MAKEKDDENLWGKLPTAVHLETPVSILKKQATKLNEISDGLLAGRVVQIEAQKPNIGHELRVTVPVLGNYSITILTLFHRITLYPVNIYIDLTGYSAEAADADALKAALRDILQSEEVRNTLVGLLAQANDAASSSGVKQTSK